LVGIVSSAILKDGRCNPDHYAIFTNVAKFLFWIKENTGLTFSNPVWYNYKDERSVIKPNTVYQQEDFKAYVGRRWHEDKLIVGKFVPQHNRFYLPYFSKELSFDDGDFELLQIHGECELKFFHFLKNNFEISDNWIPYTGTFPQNAIEGGFEGSEKLLIGRKYHNNNYLIGKIAKELKTIYVPYFGEEIAFTTEFDILVAE
jgi:hypothetical protein